MNYNMNNSMWRSKRLRAQIMCALVLGGVWTVATWGPGVQAADSEVYDLGEVIVTNVEAPKPAAESATTEETYAGGQVSRVNSIGMLGKKDFLDTPFNVTGITAETIANQQATNIIDVASNDASVSDQTLSGASNAWNIRGFKTTQQDVQFNGVYGIAPRFYTGVEGLDRVEILKGPSAMLSGMAPNDTVGGVINFVPKRAGDTPVNQVTLSYGTGHQFSQQLDMARRFNDGKYGVSLTVLNRGKQETTYKDESNSASTVSLGLDAKGERWRTSLDLGYVYNDIENPQYRVSISEKVAAKLTALPDVGEDTKFGAPGTYRRITEKYGLWKGEYDLNDDWTAYAAFGMRSTSMDYLYNTFTLSNATGSSKIAYKHNGQLNKGITAELGVKGKIETNSLDHEISIGASRIDYKRYMNNRNIDLVGTGVTSVYSPSFDAYIDDDISYLPLNDKNSLKSIAISDVISTKDKKWQFMVGGRLQSVKTDTYSYKNNNLTGVTSYDETAFSPGFAIVHKLNDKTSVYANYIQGLSAGETVTDTNASNYGEVFAPYKTKQYEVGAKFDFGKFATTVSAFQLTKPSLIENSVTNTYSVDGEQRNRGIEVSFFGEPTEGTRWLGGFTFIDAKYTTTEGGTNEGNRVAAVPRYSAVLGLEHDLKSVEGLTLTTKLTYNGSAYINATNTLGTPAWVRWDLGARYKFNWHNTPMTVRANVYNVLDTVRWRALENAVYLGTGRTFALSVTADF
ncbi:TonB-dependent siderophore receptor [uncultured Veillonella sp.]|uniref:TonB-dependent receptor n=1 Tax=uncultured Veillonella sp. TaxID=159268 RepID=UPI0025FB8DC2|nr:TonB-dependent receptor [uncultured Veillonella sp.]